MSISSMENEGILYETLTPLSASVPSDAPPPSPSPSPSSREPYVVLRSEKSLSSLTSAAPNTSATDYFSLDVGADIEEQNGVGASPPIPAVVTPVQNGEPERTPSSVLVSKLLFPCNDEDSKLALLEEEEWRYVKSKTKKEERDSIAQKKVASEDPVTESASECFADKDGIRKAVIHNVKNKWRHPENAIFEVGHGTDYECCSSYSYCQNCTEENHFPVDCKMATNWILQPLQNMNCILAKSKQCPRCKKLIEKTQGYMHISCSPPCGFDFCWLCLGAWCDHGEISGGFFACNHFEAAGQESIESDRRREKPKKSEERYTHYYERWTTNQSAKRKALVDLHQLHTLHLECLSEKMDIPPSELQFVLDAWRQIVRCRRFLKWSYVFGYYLDQDARRKLFEKVQGDAEANLERLQEYAEGGIKKYIVGEKTSVPFQSYRNGLDHLTRVTGNYFDKLVKALSGLSDVDFGGDSSKKTELKSVEGSCKGTEAENGKDTEEKGSKEDYHC